jgi:hypothetical protein
MRKHLLGVVVLAGIVNGCETPGSNTSTIGKLADTPASVTASQPNTSPSPTHTFFDASTVGALMTARAAYDEAEAAALRERERIIGSYRDVMMVSPEQVRRQLAGERVPVRRSEAWYIEQRRRNEYAAFVTAPKIEAAQEALRRATLDALSRFFAKELEAGHITRSDYQRYTREISRGYLPPFRGRKWSGNAVYEWRVGEVTPEYRRVLQEVRRLWQAQAWARSAIASHPTSPEFYNTLVREPPGK